MLIGRLIYFIGSILIIIGVLLIISGFSIPILGPLLGPILGPLLIAAGLILALLSAFTCRRQRRR